MTITRALPLANPSLSIRRATVAELFDSPAFPLLADAYRVEAGRNASLYGTPPDRGVYEQRQASGMFHVVGAFDGNDVVGFAGLFVTPVAHFTGKLIGTVETLYLSPTYRPGGGGAQLLRCVEDVAREHGATSLYLNAPIGGRLPRILERSTYTEVGRVFCRGLV